jgi:hypothetical protein
MQYERIRRDLRAVVGAEIVEAYWDYLVDEGVVEEVERGVEDVNWLARKYRRLLEIRRQPAPVSRTAPEMLDPADLPKPSGGRQPRPAVDRQQVLSLLVAHEVAKDPDVAAFRAEVLGDRLLEPGRIKDWIRAQAEADGPPTDWLTEVPLPTGHTLRWTGEAFSVEPPLTVSRARHVRYRNLHYGLPDDPSILVWPTTDGGVLDRLRRISERLANWYGWDPGQATLFVLTGWVPSVPAVRAGTRYRRLPSLARLEMRIDPTLSPREVAAEYRRARRNTLSRRYRSLTDKHILLAAHAARTEGQTWEERMQAWNQEHGDSGWEYSQVSYFSRDCSQARERLLRPPLRDDPYGDLLKGKVVRWEELLTEGSSDSPRTEAEGP